MFPIQMTFTVGTPAELARLISAVGNVPAPVVNPKSEGTTSPAAEAAKPAGKSAKGGDQAESKKPADASVAQPAATPATTAPTDAAATKLDYAKDIAPRFLKLVGSKGREVAWGIITHFKPDAPTGTRLSAVVTEEQYPEVLALIEKAEA